MEHQTFLAAFALYPDRQKTKVGQMSDAQGIRGENNSPVKLGEIYLERG